MRIRGRRPGPRGEEQRRDADREQRQADLRGGVGEAQAQHGHREDDQALRRDPDQEDLHRRRDAVDDPAALLLRGQQRGEGVVGQDDVRDVAGHRAAAAHGHPDLGGLEGARVVDAVADHRHVAALPAQGADDALLLFRRDPAEDGGPRDHLVQFGVGQRVEVGPVDRRAAVEPGLPGQGGDRAGVVAGQHLEGHALATQPLDRSRSPAGAARRRARPPPGARAPAAAPGPRRRGAVATDRLPGPGRGPAARAPSAGPPHRPAAVRRAAARGRRGPRAPTRRRRSAARSTAARR